jgi:hypothetical protein
MMEKTLNIKNNMTNEIRYNPELDKYETLGSKPKKLAIATEIIEKYALPHLLKRQEEKKKQRIAALQQALSNFLTQEPTDENLAKLEDLMLQLSPSSQLEIVEEEPELELVA